ncbi:kinase [Pseudoxanthomonas kalamensis DSM 18571]|uniref:kinase n=1 Tax=Pseudoxanthomonas kalamensis TaxID=289483 RepID=UPI001390AD24|nr:kinase [Pseudoxanthomonas kalamensis]KAF1712483.1 kinase [Pseudoxanthomonas kalamensis DSM 18571]
MTSLPLPRNSAHRRLPAAATLLKRGERLLEPDVYMTPHEGRPVVVKDYRRYRGTPLSLAARLLVWREAKMLRQLSGWRHAPALLGTAGGLLLGMEFIEGARLGEDAALMSQALFRQLGRLVAELHAGGMLHNDLHASNLVVGSGGTLFLLDYASAIRLPRWMLRLPLLRELRRADLANVLRIRQRLGGETPAGPRARVLAPRPWVRRIRDSWKRFYRWSKR